VPITLTTVVPPKQLIVPDDEDALNKVGSETIIDVFEVQPLASVTV